MGLRDLELPSATIKVSDGKNGSFTVRGLGLPDITALWRKHSAALLTAWNEVGALTAGGEQLKGDGLMALAEKAINEFPEAVAQAIALAADDPEGAAMVRRIPAPKQIEALYEVIKLTFISEAEVKKLLETITGGATNLGSLLTALDAPLLDGSGTSDAPVVN